MGGPSNARTRAARVAATAAALVGWLLVAVASAPGVSRATLLLLHDPSLDFLGTPQDGFNITLDVESGVEGWRYATLEDYLNLAAAAGIPAANIDPDLTGAPGHPSLAIVAAALGFTRPDSTYAISGESVGAGVHTTTAVITVFPFAFIPPSRKQIWTTPTYRDDSVSPFMGHALVRNVVPEPATAALIAGGLAALAMARRGRS